MKKIKSFEFKSGWKEDETTSEVNHEIQKLHDEGVEKIDINITSTGKGVMFTLIWDAQENIYNKS